MSKVTIKGKAALAPPWEPIEQSLADVSAIKSLMIGQASDVQQKRVVDWLIRATGVEEPSFRPGGDDGRRASDFAEGKRFVGLQFFILAKAVMPASQ